MQAGGGLMMREAHSYVLICTLSSLDIIGMTVSISCNGDVCTVLFVETMVDDKTGNLKLNGQNFGVLPPV